MVACAPVENLGVDQVPAELVGLGKGTNLFVVGACVHGEGLLAIVLAGAAVGAGPNGDVDGWVWWVLVLPCICLVVD